MSAALALDELDVQELFDDAGELRLFEIDENWSGFTLEGDAIFFVDTLGGWSLRCGERAVRLALEERFDDLTTEQRALACLAYLRDPSGTEQVVVGP